MFLFVCLVGIWMGGCEKLTQEQRNAVYALGQLGLGYAMPALIQVLQDQNWDVRNSAAMALDQIGKDAVPSLIQLLQDDNANVRVTAAQALVQMGENLTLVSAPLFGSQVNLSYEHKETVSLGEAIFTENGFVIASDRINVTLDAFVFSEGWYLIHQPKDFPPGGVRAGWLLLQDIREDDTPDGVAEFRAQYTVPQNTNLDFSTSGKATFVLDIIGGSLISEEDVICKWTVSKP